MAVAPAKVQQSAVVISTTNVTVSLSGVVPGHLLVLWIWQGSNAGAGFSAGGTGWQTMATTSPGGGGLSRLVGFYKLATATTESITYAANAGDPFHATMYEYSGIEQNEVVVGGGQALAYHNAVAGNGNAAAAGTSGVLPALPAAPASNWLIVSAAAWVNTVSAQAISLFGFFGQTGTLSNRLGSGDLANLAGGINGGETLAAANWGWTTSRTWCVIAAAFKIGADRDDARGMLMGSDV